jgi:hypothetical protein
MSAKSFTGTITVDGSATKVEGNLEITAHSWSGYFQIPDSQDINSIMNLALSTNSARLMLNDGRSGDMLIVSHESSSSQSGFYRMFKFTGVPD